VDFSKNQFAKMLVDANRIQTKQFKCWVFYPGMVFGSTDKWWGDYGQRDFPHEGVDFCLYEDRSGQLHRLDEKTRIPVMADGVVRAMFKDYLGQAVIVEHDDVQSDKVTYISVYAHTQPREDLSLGKSVRAGDIIATIADTRHSKANILPHLHLSIGRPSLDLVYENFVWNIMRDPGRVALLDPMDVIDGPWRVLCPEEMDGVAL